MNYPTSLSKNSSFDSYDSNYIRDSFSSSTSNSFHQSNLSSSSYPVPVHPSYNSNIYRGNQTNNGNYMSNDFFSQNVNNSNMYHIPSVSSSPSLSTLSNSTFSGQNMKSGIANRQGTQQEQYEDIHNYGNNNIINGHYGHIQHLNSPSYQSHHYIGSPHHNGSPHYNGSPHQNGSPYFNNSSIQNSPYPNQPPQFPNHIYQNQGMNNNHLPSPPPFNSSPNIGKSPDNGKIINDKILDILKSDHNLSNKSQLIFTLINDCSNLMDCVNLATVLFHTSKNRIVLTPSCILLIAKRFAVLTEKLKAREASNALYGLKLLNSDNPEVRELVQILSQRIDISSPFASQGVGNALYGCQNLSSEHDEVKKLLSVLATKIANCNDVLKAQNIGNALYGMKNMSSEYSQVREVLAALTQLISKASHTLSGQALGNSLYGLQNMSTKDAEVRMLLKALASKISVYKGDVNLKAQEVGNALYGLKKMSTDSPELCLLLGPLIEKIFLSTEELDPQAIGNSFYGLQNMKSDRPEILKLLSVLSVKVHASKSSLDGQAMGNSMYGLQGMSSEFKEVRQAVAALSNKIMQSRHSMNAQEIGNAIYGLQNMSSDYPEVRIMLQCLANKLTTGNYELTSQEIGNAMYGLQGISSKHSETRNLIKYLHLRIKESTCVLDPQGISNSLYGLQKFSSENEEVLKLISTLTKKIENSFKLFNTHHISYACFGLQKLSSYQPEIRSLIENLTVKIDNCQECMSVRQLTAAYYGLSSLSSEHIESVKLLRSLNSKILKSNQENSWNYLQLSQILYGLKGFENIPEIEELFSYLYSHIIPLHLSEITPDILTNCYFGLQNKSDNSEIVQNFLRLFKDYLVGVHPYRFTLDQCSAIIFGLRRCNMDNDIVRETINAVLNIVIQLLKRKNNVLFRKNYLLSSFSFFISILILSCFNKEKSDEEFVSNQFPSPSNNSTSYIYLNGHKVNPFFSNFLNSLSEIGDIPVRLSLSEHNDDKNTDEDRKDEMNRLNDMFKATNLNDEPINDNSPYEIVNLITKLDDKNFFSSQFLESKIRPLSNQENFIYEKLQLIFASNPAFELIPLTYFGLCPITFLIHHKKTAKKILIDYEGSSSTYPIKKLFLKLKRNYFLNNFCDIFYINIPFKYLLLNNKHLLIKCFQDIINFSSLNIVLEEDSSNSTGSINSSLYSKLLPSNLIQYFDDESFSYDLETNYYYNDSVTLITPYHLHHSIFDLRFGWSGDSIRLSSSSSHGSSSSSSLFNKNSYKGNPVEFNKLNSHSHSGTSSPQSILSSRNNSIQFQPSPQTPPISSTNSYSRGFSHSFNENVFAEYGMVSHMNTGEVPVRISSNSFDSYNSFDLADERGRALSNDSYYSTHNHPNHQPNHQLNHQPNPNFSNNPNFQNGNYYYQNSSNSSPSTSYNANFNYPKVPPLSSISADSIMNTNFSSSPSSSFFSTPNPNHSKQINYNSNLSIDPSSYNMNNNFNYSSHSNAHLGVAELKKNIN